MNAMIEEFGIVSPLGNKEEIWENILYGGLANISINSVNGINKIVSDINSDNHHINPKFFKRMDKQVVYELMAGDEAVNELSNYSSYSKEKIGVYTGSLFAQLEFGITQIKSLFESGDKNDISMYTGVSFYYGASSGEISIQLKSKGENASICSGACAGIDCVIEAGKNIDRKINDLILAVGGENLEEDVIFDMISNNSSGTSLFNPDTYFYSSGAVCVLLASQKNSKSKIEIISTCNANDCDSLLNCGEYFDSVLENSILQCISEAHISINEVDLIIPGFNNRDDYDLHELSVLSKLFKERSALVYSPVPYAGDMLSASGNLKLYIACKCMQHKIIPANSMSFFNADLYSNNQDLFVTEKTTREVKYALIIQRDIVGGRISLVLINNKEL